MTGGTRVLAGRAELAEVAARDLLERLADAQERGEVPRIGLTGGSVADAVHREVARLAAAEEAPRVDWSRVDVFWGDERFVDRDDPERNERQAREALLDHVGVDPARVHPVPATDEEPDVCRAAEHYAEVVRQHGAGPFDVLMLGLGPDGHVASLFPGHPAVSVVDTAVVGLSDSPKPPPARVSLTLPELARARAVWFLVSGAEKAEAVARTRRPGVEVAQAPGSALLGTPEVRWYLDEAAAADLG